MSPAETSGGTTSATINAHNYCQKTAADSFYGIRINSMAQRSDFFLYKILLVTKYILFFITQYYWMYFFSVSKTLVDSVNHYTLN